MNLPVVLGTSSGNSAANAASTVITLPSGVAAGDGLLVVFVKDGSAAPTGTTGASWNLLVSGSTGSHWAGVYWRVATGSDSLTINHATEGTAYCAYRLSGHDYTISPAVATPATGTSTAPNPPSLDPSGWAADDALWIAAYAWDGNVAHSAYPYASNLLTNRWASTDGVGVASSTRESAGSVEDPTAGTLASSTPWVAFTLAVRAYGIFDTGIFDIFTFDTLADAITGTVTAVELTADTSSVSGQVAVAGTMSATGGAADTSSVSGQVAVSGSSAAQESGADVFSASGLVAYTGVAGSMAALEATADTIAVSGTVAVAGTMSATEAGADVSSMTARATATGAMSVAEVGADACAAQGGALVLASLWTQESGADTHAGSGSVAVSGAMDAVGTGSDESIMFGTVGYDGSSGVMDGQEVGADTYASSGTVSLGGSMSAVEAGPDLFTVDADLPVTGSFAVLEVGADSILVTGASVPVTGTFASTEATADTASIFGVVNYTGISGVMDGQEVGTDTAAMSGTVVWGSRTGTMDAAEAGADTLAASGSLGWWGPTLLYVIYPSALSPPTAAQIRQGLSSLGTAATAAGWQESPGAGGEFTFPAATGLQANTSYRVSFVWSDGAEDSNVVTSDPFVTMALRTGTMVAQESGSDPSSIFGQVAVRGVVVAQELFGDTMEARSRAEGVMNAIEPATDDSAISGQVEVRGSGTAVESGNDLAAMILNAYATAVMEAQETGSDTFAGVMVKAIIGALDAVEGGEDTFSGTATLRTFESVVQMLVAPTANEADPAEKVDELAVTVTGQKYLRVPVTSRRISIS